MKISKFVICIAALGLVGVAIAGDDAKTRIAIKASVDGSDENVHFAFSSGDAGIDLHDMQVGENRSIVDESGKTVLVTRTEEGFSFDIDGKTIEMPAFDGDHMDGVMIMSGKPVDDATQQAIRSLLEAAGHGSDVSFIDHESHHGDGPQHVKVIRKTVELKD